jgi:NTP pyrophosphatase (non-canonical NTP hydrolase)
LRELINKTLDWARDRNLLDNKDATRQALKMVSEVGEFADEILKGDIDKQRMEMGDVVVTIILTGAKLGIDIEEALAAAYEKISNRTGRTINGVFVKDTTT